MNALRLHIDGTLTKVQLPAQNSARLSFLQEAVGGFLDARTVWRAARANAVLWLNDEGLMLDLPCNLWGAIFGAFVGEAVLAMVNDEGEDISLQSLDSSDGMQVILQDKLFAALHGAGLEHVIGAGADAVKALQRDFLERMHLHPGEPNIIVMNWPKDE